MLFVDVITIFPELIETYVNTGVLKRTNNSNNIKVNLVNLRDFTTDRHKTVDDTPFGGGAGMIMKLEPFEKAINYVRSKSEVTDSNFEVWLFAAHGQLFTQNFAKELANEAVAYNKHIVLLCGRYEGIDNRIMHFVDKVVSVGPYILTGGELGAMVVIDAVARLLPDILGNSQSAQDETEFVEIGNNFKVVAEYPQYTRPFEYKTKNGVILKVPEVLSTGNHKKIKEWRESQKKTKKLNP